MRIIVFGGTGLIGKELIASPQLALNDIIIVSRRKVDDNYHKRIRHVQYSPDNTKGIVEYFSGVYGIVNLAGENIGAKPWTKEQKSKILQSRLNITGLISKLINEATQNPKFVIQASATGFYGNGGDEILTETSPHGEGFLADVTKKWEDSLNLKNDQTTRLVYIRTGLVLSKTGGLLERLKLPFMFFSGGHMGNGNQWMPWIHIQDEVSAICFLIKNESASGVFNLCAPQPQQMRLFSKILAKKLKRRSWLHIPRFIILFLLGNFGQELLLNGQRAIPQQLLDLGYKFQFTELESALSDIIGNE